MPTATCTSSTIKYGPTIQGNLVYEITFSETEARLDIPYSGRLVVKLPPVGSGALSVGNNPMMPANVSGVSKAQTIAVGRVRPSGNTKVVFTIPVSVALSALLPMTEAQTKWVAPQHLTFELRLDPDIGPLACDTHDVKI